MAIEILKNSGTLHVGLMTEKNKMIDINIITPYDARHNWETKQESRDE